MLSGYLQVPANIETFGLSSSGEPNLPFDVGRLRHLDRRRLPLTRQSNRKVA